MLARDALFSVRRQGHAPARSSRDDRERLRLAAGSSPWLADTLAELLAFPAGRHDDQVELDGAGAGVGEAEAGGRGGDDRLLAAAGGEGVI